MSSMNLSSQTSFEFTWDTPAAMGQFLFSLHCCHCVQRVAPIDHSTQTTDWPTPPTLNTASGQQLCGQTTTITTSSSVVLSQANFASASADFQTNSSSSFAAAGVQVNKKWKRWPLFSLAKEKRSGCSSLAVLSNSNCLFWSEAPSSVCQTIH